jgi:hypothetical protein
LARARKRLSPVTATELAQQLSDAALAYRASLDEGLLSRVESLARDAATHVGRMGEGTVDHIILSSVLKLIVVDMPSVAQVLQQAGWRWLP